MGRPAFRRPTSDSCLKIFGLVWLLLHYYRGAGAPPPTLEPTRHGLRPLRLHGVGRRGASHDSRARLREKGVELFQPELLELREERVARQDGRGPRLGHLG